MHIVSKTSMHMNNEATPTYPNPQTNQLPRGLSLHPYMRLTRDIELTRVRIASIDFRFAIADENNLGIQFLGQFNKFLKLVLNICLC